MTMKKINSNIMNGIIHGNAKPSVLRWVILGIMFLFLSNDMSATHIVGGDFTYTKLADGRFEIKLTVRRDCINGEEEFDSLASVFLYNEFGTPLQNFQSFGFSGGNLEIPFMGSDTIDEVLIFWEHKYVYMRPIILIPFRYLLIWAMVLLLPTKDVVEILL